MKRFLISALAVLGAATAVAEQVVAKPPMRAVADGICVGTLVPALHDPQLICVQYPE